MPSHNSNGALPVLTLLSNPVEDVDPAATCGLPSERPLNRNALLEIAPDREALIMSSASAEGIRLALKIRVASDARKAHWLFQRQPDSNIKTEQIDKYESPISPSRNRNRPGSDRSKRRRLTEDTSMDVDQNSPPSSIRNEPAHSRRRAKVRRSISASVLPNTRRTRGSASRWADAPPMPNIDRALFSNDRNYDGLRLSTFEKLVSPRPTNLPTHLLVLFSESKIPYPKLTLPINDLLFALHVPNLANMHELPHKLPDELPRVLMKVTRLEGWRDLVVWMHTRNQAQLIRSVVPEWVRDLMHPLPQPATAVLGEGDTEEGNARKRLKPKKSLMKLAGRGVLRKNSTLSNPDVAITVEGRTLDSIAQEIAEMDTARNGGEIDESQTLVGTMISLNILRENLQEIGYFGRDLWLEIGICWEILVRAVNWQAKMRVEG
ncbi:hypothetical protein BJ138DRAFT_1140770 [Hygrophoropsis aurantiaca]|uniref:Uncharacterized protein n=1 Tax=Hygrophoropsis aurantiaca TaxID=72124 RepID=A0ACB8AQY1_9AGAM|nr:hypothetical protein BJ138DRAFT_1140770 [Hygrophoropsis aurantiaca]